MYSTNCCTANLDDTSVAILSALLYPISQNLLPNYNAIYLFPTHKEVDNFNKHFFCSSNPHLKHLFNTLVQVMLVRNLDEELTNDTIGIVKGFYMYKKATDDKSYNKKLCAQYPSYR